MRFLWTLCLWASFAAPMLVFAETSAAPDGATANATSATGAEGSPALRLVLFLRPRYNVIEESDKPKKTDVGTMRTIVGLDARPLETLRLHLELLHTDQFGKRLNDDLAQFGTSAYPLLPDPKTNALNQAYLDYLGLPDTQLRAGQQVVRMGNERLISDNDFRQIPTLFTGLLVTNTAFSETEIKFGRFERVRTALATRVPLKLTTFELARNLSPDHIGTLYGYWLNQPLVNDFTGLDNSSHRVFGARVEGAWALADGWTLPYTVDWAQQKAYAGGDSVINAGYSRLGLGVASANLGVRVDQEVKQSHAGRYGFQTPYSDLYAYNGWTLQLIDTPPQGLKDTWLTVRGEWRKWIAYAEYHRFHTDVGSIALARERDISLTYPLQRNVTARLQHAVFSPASALMGGVFVKKTWLTISYAY